MLNREEFHLLLLDILMPGKSGIEMLEEVLGQHPDLAVIMVTGVTDKQTKVRALRNGARYPQ